ncbi:hypothetical protein LXA43DRAFT_900616 [Ganoderma leucocontextum]|nr:hypothetical protein LXA43DRAFT_900616 [Ganoderma leucocontextum]
MAQLPSWRIVPRDTDDLPGWLCVDRLAGGSDAIVLAHPDVIAGGHVLMTLHLQGIVDACILYWGPTMVSRRVEQAARAKQMLSLRGDGCMEAFEAQRVSLEAIRDVVLQLLPVGNYDRIFAMTSDAIVLKRRVFMKVSTNIMDAVAILLQEDPLGRARSVSDLWRITHRVKSGHQVEGGVIQPTMAMNIRRGDLVDVAATVEVVMTRSKRGRQVELMFRPEEVVRLRSARELKVRYMNEVDGL